MTVVQDTVIAFAEGVISKDEARKVVARELGIPNDQPADEQDTVGQHVEDVIVLEISEEDARTLLAYCSIEDPEAASFRLHNGAIYEIEDALEAALSE